MSIRAIFQAGQTQITVNGLHQWDYGRKLEIQADDIQSVIEVHFACAGMTEAVVRTCVILGGVAEAAIPDQCLEQTTPITAWVYAVGDTSGATVKTIRLPIIARTKPQPAATVPTDFSDKYTEALAAFNDAVDGLREGQLIALEAEHAAAADHASTATRANHATSADSASLADHATNAGHATSADSATNANHAKSADQASHASQATYAEKFAKNAVVPRADVAELTEGVVEKIDDDFVWSPHADYAPSSNAGSAWVTPPDEGGEPIYVPQALYAKYAASAQSAGGDNNGSSIYGTYAYQPLRTTFTNQKLSAGTTIGTFGDYHKFRRISTVTLNLTYPGIISGRTCLLVGDVYSAGYIDDSGNQLSGTMYASCTLSGTTDAGEFTQQIINLKFDIYLPSGSKSLRINPLSMQLFTQKLHEAYIVSDTDTWQSVDLSQVYLKSCVVSFA